MGLHIPEAYGGSAAGSLAFCLAAEEVAWACASTSTIFLVQNLGRLPDHLRRQRGAEAALPAARWPPER